MAAAMASKVRRGKAFLRIIAAIDLLLANEPDGADNHLLVMFRRFASQRLGRLASELDAAAIAELLAATDSVWWTDNEPSRN